MRVALIHNPGAGDGVYENDDLERLFRDAGHETQAYRKKGSELRRAAESGADVMVVAGGDGSVAKAAARIQEHGSKMALYILPVGTANNIARSLTIDGSTPMLIKALASARPRKLDIGRASGPWGDRSFVESAGVGFFGTMLQTEHSLGTKTERFFRNLRPVSANPFEMAALGLSRIVRREPVRHYSVIADGNDLSGDYIAVEALNITSIGPRIALAPNAHSDDGMLELLLVPPDARDALAEYVGSMGRSGSLPAPGTRRVTRIEVSWEPGRGHLDDAPWPAARDEANRTDHKARVTIDVLGAIDVLVPT
jgi:diacylglycerol kinase (ATP)